MMNWVPSRLAGNRGAGHPSLDRKFFFVGQQEPHRSRPLLPCISYDERSEFARTESNGRFIETKSGFCCCEIRADGVSILCGRLPLKTSGRGEPAQSSAGL